MSKTVGYFQTPTPDVKAATVLPKMGDARRRLRRSGTHLRDGTAWPRGFSVGVGPGHAGDAPVSVDIGDGRRCHQVRIHHSTSGREEATRYVCECVHRVRVRARVEPLAQECYSKLQAVVVDFIREAVQARSRASRGED